VRFVGPPPAVLGLAGDTTLACDVARRAGVPVLEGSGAVADTMAGHEAAASLGYPLFVPAAMGGGGCGMRLVHSRDELAEALSSAVREAHGAFGDGTVYL
jgi:pyruvate carboxylase